MDALILTNKSLLVDIIVLALLEVTCGAVFRTAPVLMARFE